MAKIKEFFKNVLYAGCIIALVLSAIILYACVGIYDFAKNVWWLLSCILWVVFAKIIFVSITAYRYAKKAWLAVLEFALMGILYVISYFWGQGFPQAVQIALVFWICFLLWRGFEELFFALGIKRQTVIPYALAFVFTLNGALQSAGLIEGDLFEGFLTNLQEGRITESITLGLKGVFIVGSMFISVWAFIELLIRAIKNKSYRMPFLLIAFGVMAFGAYLFGVQFSIPMLGEVYVLVGSLIVITLGTVWWSFVWAPEVLTNMM